MRDADDLLAKSTAEIARAEDLLEFGRRTTVKARELFESYGLDLEAWNLRCPAEPVEATTRGAASAPDNAALLTRRRMRRSMV